MLIALAMVCFAAYPAAALASPLAEKQARAAELDSEVGQLESKYSDLQERYRGARVELVGIQKDVVVTQRKLVAARADLRGAKSRLELRAIAIYRDGSGSTQLLELARAGGSFQDFFEKLDAIERVGNQDADILGRVRTAAEQVQASERKLRAARDQQAKVVKRAAKSKKKMGVVLVNKQTALGSVTAEIRTIMNQQRAAQATKDVAASRARIAVINNGGTPAEADAAASQASDGEATTAPVTANGGGAATAPSSDGASASPAQPSETPSIPLPPASGSASAAAGIAMGKVGAKYVYGASGPDSFDCSGLIAWAFAQAGRSGLPHSTYSLMGMGVEVPLSQAQSGDIVITDGGGHAGIYVGGGSFVHAPRAGRTVSVESLSYYSVVTVRRI